MNRGLEHEPSSSTASADRDALVQSKAKVQAISDLVTDKRFSLALTQVGMEEFDILKYNFCGINEVR